MLKLLINNFLRKFGYQINKLPNGFTLNRNINWLIDYKIKSIIDIGANEGQFAEFANNYFKGCKIYCFEPIKKCYSKIENKFSNYNNIKIYNYALGDKNEVLEINLNDFSPSSSILNMTEEHISNFPHTRDFHKEKIEVLRLDDFIKNKIFEKDIMVKIDVQGYEKNVLIGGINFINNNVKIVIIETSIIKLYQDEASFDDIYSYMKSLGFSYAGNLNQLYGPQNGKILQVDALFIK